MRRLLLLAALVTACAPHSAPPEPPAEAKGPALSDAEAEALATAYGELGGALGRGDFPAALAALDRAAAIDAGDPSLDYLHASVLAAAKLVTDAQEELTRLDKAGSLLVPQKHDFPGLEGPEFERLVKAARARLPASASVRAFTLAERDLIPEGIAHDPKTGTFFVGSIYKRKIVAVDAKGAARDLVVDTGPPNEGLYSPLGMKFDAARGSLWVASAAVPSMLGYVEAEHRGRAALHEIDPSTGKMLARYPLDAKRQGLLNDVVIGEGGEVYVTDSEGGGVHVLRPGPDARLEEFVPPGSFGYPNGIALSDDGGTLFVADYVRGVTAIPLATRQLRVLPHPRGVFTHGFDGLYFLRGALIGVDNGAGGGRIVRLSLTPSFDRIEAATVLEAGHPDFIIPTTGVLVDDSLVYIANSQLRSFEGDKIFPPEKLFPVQVLRLPLR
ncbi:SMP-30/gluconolactonase/LRE family protein [Nannocystis radixulma]|uniref:SMP-30/gluconolactonase/LRE family protein n=1 Tax=Nannocystis radixulma TaxID=2995305 RepID=A0ABT5BD54_9BACT|nr:SMP-30/gluconolactonase/LRE family protein [Nannocystis radixulma]MDC0672094.1 SMP-30/gluconolactonase/LRE family protein [Nannocystis radixulma]